jgi:hypothetical protein
MGMAGRAALRQAAPDAAPADLFRAPAAPLIAPDAPDHLRLALRLTCRRPELQPLCPGVRFAIDPLLDLPFRVTGGGRIVLHPASLAEPTAAALTVRHALELALWQRLGGAAHGVRAFLACRVAARYAGMLPAAERKAGLMTLPEWLRAAYRIVAEDAPDRRQLPTELQRLDGGEVEPLADGPDPLPAELLELAAPSEHLLVGGGGSRLHLDPASGLNIYGCGAVPCPTALAFASSTASAISAPAYATVEALRQSWLEAALAGRLWPAVTDEIERAKRDILARCGAGELPGIEVILTPSGTDGELVALHLARRGDRRLVNLVIAPDETGSGVVDAAHGRHFASETPLGATVARSEPLAGLEAARITVETVAIRGPEGTARALATIDTEVAGRVRRAVTNGARCLVHLLDASKSGLAAPSPGVVGELCARHGARVEVVVDACQMRLGAARLRSYLERGWMLLVTGSKYAMGPPFAGALLVPERLAAAIGEVPPLPPGFAQYFAQAEWPDAWRPLTAGLPERPNLGLLLRWHAARVEMAALEAVPAQLRARIVSELGAAIRAALATAPLLEPVEPAQRDGASTIFPFRLLKPEDDGNRPLSAKAARRAWRWLREDLSDRLPAAAAKAERRLAAQVCQLGQPIALGPAGALRICIGAQLITAVAFESALGKDVAQRLARQIGRALLVLDKAQLIARYFDDLDAAPE